MGPNDESELLSEVIAVCNELGHKNKRLDNKYVLNKKDANNVIKDLIRFLRNDDKHKFTVRKQLGFTNIVDNDLIPIVEQYSLEDIDLFDKLLRLLVDLTNPTIILFRQKMPTDKMEAQKYLELQSLLYSYKLSFGSHKKFWVVLAKHLTRILELDEDNRQIEDTLMFERILILIRNVLHIPIDTHLAKAEADNDTNSQDRLLEVLHSSGINDLILFLSSDDSHQQFCFHLIEIISLIFREQNAEFIAKSVSNSTNNGLNVDTRSDFEKEIDSKELKELKARDRSVSNSVPHNRSRFNGTFYVKNMKSISDRNIIFHKNPENLDKMNFDANKCSQRKRKSQQPMTDSSTNRKEVGTSIVHKSSPKIRKILFDFCTDFLNNSYNQFMRQLKDSLNRNIGQENDETYYLWAIQFFMEFNRSNTKTNDNSLVSETMSVQTFHFLQTQIETYLDILKTQKEDLSVWSRRLHYGLRAYRELLFSLNYFYCSRDESIRQTAKGIKKQIFYEVEYRDLLLLLLHDYNESKMSKAFLKDLIETNHIFLKMLENYYKTNSRLLVREKIKKKRKTNKKKKPKEKTPPEEIWIEIMETVSDALQGNIDLPSPEDDITVRAFDPTSDKPMDEQKMEVMRRVNHFLRQKSVVEAIALYRDARNCWSGDEDNAFGAPDILPEDELLSLNEVLLTDFPEEPTYEENEEEVDEELVNEESNTRVREVEVQLSEVINKYCQQNVIKTFGISLKNYDKNSDETNHCLAKMLHRIGFDCKMHAMLFQLSIFKSFQRILSDPLRNENLAVKELSTFAKYIISKFKSVAEKNNKVFIELLFWKNSREATDLEEGYNSNPQSNSKQAKQLWTEEQELELQVLFEELKDKSDGDKDYIDLILEKMIDENKTRRQLIRQLKQQVRFYLYFFLFISLFLLIYFRAFTLRLNLKE